jgi:hypothetical protein
MFKIITLCDSNYFDCGKLFLKTRNIAKDHDIVLYGPDLTKKQINILTNHNIKYKKVNKKKWDTQMQFMKFELILNELQDDVDKKYKGFLLIDWDIFFVRDWARLYDHDFDLCITVRPTEIKKRILRALGCGGGFFFKHSSKELFEFAQKVILEGGNIGMPEYDRIWKTLEQGRPKHKTHYRTQFRWWVDQVFISCIVLRFLEERAFRQKFGLEPVFYNFMGYKIAFVSEKNYNRIKSNAIVGEKEKNVFIKHLQYHGRKQLVGPKKARIKEKLNG